MNTATMSAAFGDEHITTGVGRLTEDVLAKGEGCHVYTEDGKKMLDMTSYVGVGSCVL